MLPTSQLSKAISRISTEYRLQFAWPRRSQLTNGDASSGVGVAAAGGGGSSTGGGLGPGTAAPPRKSLSMGALKQGIVPSAPAPVHKKRSTDVDRKRDGRYKYNSHSGISSYNSFHLNPRYGDEQACNRQSSSRWSGATASTPSTESYSRAKARARSTTTSWCSRK